MPEPVEVCGEARIAPEVLEHRHPRAADPRVAALYSLLEALERPVHLAERRMHDRKVERLDVLGGGPRFELREARPRLAGSPGARPRPRVIADIERRTIGQLDAAGEDAKRVVVPPQS